MLLLGLALAPSLAAPPRAVQVWVSAPDAESREELRELGADFAEGVDGDRVLVQLQPQALEQLPARFEPVQQPPLAGIAEHFHDLDELREALEELAEEPGVELVQVGESVQGRPILGLRMGNPEGHRWRILGAHHGDELSSSELALATAQALVHEPAWSAVLEQSEVLLVPVVNPDGLVASSRNNANEVDLNRNYSHQWRDSVFSGEAPFTEPEVRAIRTLSVYAPPAGGLSLHSGAENIGYPWNYTRTDTPEEPGLLELAEVYGEACSQPGFYVTNGADWYITYGDTNDWSLGLQGSWDFTVEVSDTKAPDQASLEQALGQHLPAVLALLEQQPRVRGQVLDATTGRAIEAELSLDRDSSPWISDPVSGRWWRWLETGIYTLTVSSPGYLSQELELRVHASEPSELEVLLLPASLQDEALVPSLVSRSEALVELWAPGEPEALMFSRPGFDPVEVERSEQGLVLDTSTLAAGPWTVSSEHWVRPRGLLVSDPEDGAQLSSARVDEHIELSGRGFGPGTRAWLLYGPERALQPIEVLEESEELLLLEGSSLPADGTVDLLVLSNGSELAVTDLLGDIGLDTSLPEPGPDTGDSQPPRAKAPAELFGYRGCQSTTPTGTTKAAALLALAAALSLVARREKRCR